MGTKRLSGLIALWVCTHMLTVNAEVVEFAATAFQQSPNAPIKTARMNVSKEAVRREFEHNFQQYVEIYFPNKGLHYLLSPVNKTYQVVKSTPNPVALRGQQIKSTNPCRDNDDESCRLIGEEKLNNQAADKWEISRNIEGRTIKALVWVDKQRGQVLRQFYPDGTVVELVKTGSMVINDRDTERWELQTKKPNGYMEKTIQWYDPELAMTIKEVLPGGFVRELKNITTGKQAAKLFTVPSDYQEIKQQNTQTHK